LANKSPPLDPHFTCRKRLVVQAVPQGIMLILVTLGIWHWQWRYISSYE
jgi:hypothetical protein